MKILVLQHEKAEPPGVLRSFLDEDGHTYDAAKLDAGEAVEERGLPFLRLCRGHQLLAEALGGEVGPSDKPEIGVMDVQLTKWPSVFTSTGCNCPPAPRYLP